MTRSLILDFGGVISRTLFETHDDSERALGLPPGSLKWRGPFAPETDELWQSMQAGNISERDYWLARARETGALVGERWDTMKDLVRRTRGADPGRVIRPEAREAIIAAKAAGAKLAILSNELDLFYGRDLRERIPLLHEFDVITDATYTGILKPDRRAYDMCLAALGRGPGDCVFVDDQPRNVEGAERLGIASVAFDVAAPAASFARALALLTAGR